MIYNTWSVAIRKMYKLDRATHRYFIEPVSQMKHLKLSLMKRFGKFADTLYQTEKQAARYVYNALVNDCRSTIGRNKRFLVLNDFHESLDNLSFNPTPKEEIWRLSVVDDLLYARDYENCIGWTTEDISDTLIELCTS